MYSHTSVTTQMIEDNLKCSDLDHDLMKYLENMTSSEFDYDFDGIATPTIADMDQSLMENDNLKLDLTDGPSQLCTMMASGNPFPGYNNEPSPVDQFSSSCSVVGVNTPENYEGAQSAWGIPQTATIDSTELQPQMENSLSNFGASLFEDRRGAFNSNFSSDDSTSFSNFGSPVQVCGKISSKGPSKSSEGLTDEEKYLKHREQNNFASKEYRKRKKSRRQTAEENKQKLEAKKQNLKEILSHLQTRYDQCLSIRKRLEELGLGYLFSGRH